MDIGAHEGPKVEPLGQPEPSSEPEGIRIFEANAWVPMWEQSIPGKSIALGFLPTSCNFYLEPDPHFVIEVNLEGEEALKHHRIITQQGERVPMQFEGLEYENYPIRGNNYSTWTIANDKFEIHAKYRLIDKGLRLLRLTDNHTYSADGYVINLALENHQPLTINLDDWIVTLSPQMRESDSVSKFAITHKINITNHSGHFSEFDLEKFRANLRIVFSTINIQCCEIVLTQTFDIQSILTGFLIDQLHCDEFREDVLQYAIWSSNRNEETVDIASKLYKQLLNSGPHYLEGLEMLTCSSYQSIPSYWTILEKTCGSRPGNVREALKSCVESLNIPSEYMFLKEQLDVGQDADFIDVFYGMKNHFAHQKNKIVKGMTIRPETHSIVKTLAQPLCWCKVLTDIEVKCLLWQEARVSFADWEFKYDVGQPPILGKFQADGTYNALATIRRLLRAGETPGRTSAYFETPEGRIVICEATEWPREMPKG